MEYRTNRRTGDKISVIGLGTSYIAETDEKEAIEALSYAYEHGINYADLATADAKTFSYYGKAFAAVRKDMRYQVHFGADYTGGKYGWTTDLETVKRSVEQQLKELKTDYIDYGFVHCLDEEDDWSVCQKGGVLDYLWDFSRLRQRNAIILSLALSHHRMPQGNVCTATTVSPVRQD